MAPARIPAVKPPLTEPGAEREIKLQVPAHAWDGVLEALQGPGLRELPLHALYCDTADRALASAGIALRLRREGTRWVQTVKCAGAGPLERMEDNVKLAAVHPGRTPSPDLNRHTDPGLRERLRLALLHDGGAPQPVLRPVFEVRVLRRERKLRRYGCVVELALDEGDVHAGAATRPIRELELELVCGDFAGLVRLAREWRARHGLYLDLVSKAERGLRLTHGQAFVPPVSAGALSYPPGVSMGSLSAAVLASCLAQVAGNAGELAAGSADPEHVHQLRVGLRRLRTALRALAPLAPDRQAHEPALAAVFAELGARRDQDHVLRQVLPRIKAAGAPPIAPLPPRPQAATPQALAGDAALQDALLALLAREVQLRADNGAPVRRRLRAALTALLEKVLRDGHRFKALELQAQHRVRKRLKRLRYLAEFAAPLFPVRRVREFVGPLQAAQDALGRYNDERVAQALYAPLAADGDPGARFALDWLEARRPRQAGECQKLLRALAKVRAFWPK